MKKKITIEMMSKSENIKYLLSKPETRIALVEKSIYYFGFYYFLASLKFKSAKFHRQWCKAMNDDDKNIVLEAFRESAKTFWAKVKFIHNIVFKKRRFLTYYCYDKKKAAANMFDISMMLLINKKIKEDFGRVLAKGRFLVEDDEDVPQKKTVSEFITSTRIKCKAFGMGESPRGEQFMTTEGTFRPDFAILDDMDVLKSVNNPEVIDKNYEWLLNELFGGLTDDSQIIVIGNTIKTDGILPRLKNDYKNDPDWEFFKKAIMENGDITWPERYTMKDIEKKKRKGKIFFNQNFMLIPATGGETIVKRSHLKYWDVLPVSVKIVFGIDPAFSEKTNTDPMALTITAHLKIGEETRKYIIDSFEFVGDEKDEDRFCNSVEELYHKWNCSLINIESNNGGIIIGRMLKKRNLAVVVLSATKDKITRLREYQGEFERGVIHFSREMDTKLENQLIAFPHVKHDDMVDSMVYSFNGDGLEDTEILYI